MHFNDIYSNNCEDYSDQIFKSNSKCEVHPYMDIYKNLFCTTEKMNYYTYWKDIYVCRKNQFILWSNYWNPHNCSESCAEPGDGCSACTNSEYFHCIKGNVSVCLHPYLECDGHPQCDDAEDEDIDKCYSRYVKQRTVPNYATLKCVSGMYPNMITLATVCDGIVECQNSEDEPQSCESTSWIWFYVSIGSIILSYIF